MVEIPNFLTLDVSDFESNLISAETEVGQFQGTVESASASSSTGFLRIGSSLSHLGVSAFVVADRITIASEAVQNAQTRQILAQERLTAAIDKYGAGSAQATRATQELEIATRGVDIAHERYNIRLLFAVGSVLPSFIVGIQKAITAIRAMSVANDVATASNIRLAISEEEVIAATGVGIPLALAGAAAAAAIGATAGYALAGGFGGGGGGGGNTTVYANDINVHGVQGPADFGQALVDPRATR